MLFNSHLFIFGFLPIALVLFFSSRALWGNQPALWILSILSIVFYGWNYPPYVLLLLISIIVNYSIGRYVGLDVPFKKLLFIVGISFNLLFLSFFKYFDFLIENINIVASSNIPVWNIALPLGISFFTLQQISYLVDVYQGETAEKNLGKYSLFVSFFPELISGPIVHFKDLLAQFDNPKLHRFNFSSMNLGFFIFSIGLFKKVVIADSLSTYVSSAFQSHSLQFSEAWIGSLSYTFQLYFDFSGYSDMAVGLARMFNIGIPWNFQSPYKATSLIDFWKRWHISLTNFITTYVFTPFISSFKKATFNVMLLGIFFSMLVSGIWHGANWTFVFWGLLHGFGLVINHSWKKKKIKMPKLLGVFLTFIFANFSFVLFRAPSLEKALVFLGSMIGRDGFRIIKPVSDNINFILLAGLVAFAFPSLQDLSKKYKENYSFMLLAIICFVLSLLNLTRETEFLYFNF